MMLASVNKPNHHHVMFSEWMKLEYFIVGCLHTHNTKPYSPHVCCLANAIESIIKLI